MLEETIIKIARSQNEFGLLEDGYYYFFPSSSGAMSAGILRILADELDRLNAPYDAEVRAHFTN